MKKPSHHPRFKGRSSCPRSKPLSFLSVLFTTALLCFTASLNLRADEPAGYVLDFVVLTVPVESGEEMEVTGTSTPAGGRVKEGQEARAYAGVSGIAFNGLSLTLEPEAGTLLWNGNSEPPPGSGVEFLIRRRLDVMPVRETMIRAVVSDFQYLEQKKDGSYELRTLNRKDLPGMLLTCRIKRSKKTPQESANTETPVGSSNSAAESWVELSYDLRIVMVEEREKLPGVSLEIGKPDLSRFTMKRRVTLRETDWHLISGHLISEKGADRSSYLVILTRVTATP